MKLHFFFKSGNAVKMKKSVHLGLVTTSATMTASRTSNATTPATTSTSSTSIAATPATMSATPTDEATTPAKLK
jgi:hypothetical protein